MMCFRCVSLIFFRCVSLRFAAFSLRFLDAFSLRFVNVFRLNRFLFGAFSFIVHIDTITNVHSFHGKRIFLRTLSTMGTSEIAVI